LMSVTRDGDALVATLFKTGTLGFSYQLSCQDSKPCFGFTVGSFQGRIFAPDCNVTESRGVSTGAAMCPAANVKAITLVLAAQGSVEVLGPQSYTACSPAPVTVKLMHDVTSAQLNQGCPATVVCGVGYSVVAIAIDASDDVDGSCKRYSITRG
jgi:hypothetical protein